MDGRAIPTADIMNGMMKWATQTTKRVAEREVAAAMRILAEGKKGYQRRGAENAEPERKTGTLALPLTLFSASLQLSVSPLSPLIGS
jgi:hypothetical protein